MNIRDEMMRYATLDNIESVPTHALRALSTLCPKDGHAKLQTPDGRVAVMDDDARKKIKAELARRKSVAP